MAHSNSYIIHGGDAGVRRLEFLTRASAPPSLAFLKEAGLRSGMKVLEVGCAGGAITSLLASESLQGAGQILGIDFDERALQVAKGRTYPAGVKTEFRAFDVTQSDLSALGGGYDFIYCRFVLSHLKDPQSVLKNLRRLLKRGGVIALEDIQFDGHFSIPQNDAFDRYVDLFRKSAEAKGAHPNIGPELPAMLEDAGLSKVELRVSTPAFRDGDGKQIASLTLSSIRESAIGRLVSENEFQKLERDLALFTADPQSILSLARIFQTWGRNLNLG